MFHVFFVVFHASTGKKCQGKNPEKFHETQKFDGTRSANNTTRSYKSHKLIKKKLPSYDAWENITVDQYFWNLEALLLALHGGFDLKNLRIIRRSGNRIIPNALLNDKSWFSFLYFFSLHLCHSKLHAYNRAPTIAWNRFLLKLCLARFLSKSKAKYEQKKIIIMLGRNSVQPNVHYF